MAEHQVIVRHARREDVPAILGMIRELADYEHELHSVEATEEKLLSTLAFAPSPASAPLASGDAARLPGTDAAHTEPTSPSRPARCLLAIDPSSNEPVGIALYFYNYSTWRAKPGIYLEDLYVKQASRKRGFGLRLLVELAREVVAMGGARLEWAVLKWNEPTIRFYEHVVGAKLMGEWVGCRVDGEALAKLTQMLG